MSGYAVWTYPVLWTGGGSPRQPMPRPDDSTSQSGPPSGQGAQPSPGAGAGAEGATETPSLEAVVAERDDLLAELEEIRQQADADVKALEAALEELTANCQTGSVSCQMLVALAQ